ncbi:MAG: hypothetical protein LBH66_06570, partial [Oscillospiraceae bacterium]|nr:hypothetical protein [Oscillospiraceae bacterium]
MPVQYHDNYPAANMPRPNDGGEFKAYFEPLLNTQPRAEDEDEAVYPRRRTQARALKDAAIHAMPETAQSITGPTFDEDEEYFKLNEDTACLRYILKGKTLGFLYDGSLGSMTYDLDIPPTLEEAQEQGGCLDLRGYVPGPKTSDPAVWAQYQLDQERKRKLDELTERYKAELAEEQFGCAASAQGYQHLAGAQCAEPAQLRSYNPFTAYVVAREVEGARAAAAAEQTLNPYGGYLGEDGDMEISYGPYQEIEPYIS